MTPEHRAWRTIRRIVAIVLVLGIVRPGTAGLLSVQTLSAANGPARDLVRSIVRLAGQEPAGDDLKGDLDRALELAEAAATTGDSADSEIAREAPFRPLGDDAGRGEDGVARRQEPDSRGPRWVSPANAPLARAARVLRSTL